MCCVRVFKLYPVKEECRHRYAIESGHANLLTESIHELLQTVTAFDSEKQARRGPVQDPNSPDLDHRFICIQHSVGVCPLSLIFRNVNLVLVLTEIFKGQCPSTFVL